MNYNDYNITVFGKYSLVIVDDESLEPNFEKGSLLVIEKNDSSEVEPDDYIFFYDTYENQISVNLGVVADKKEVTETETTYVVDGNHDLSSEYFIGKANTTIIYKKVGSILRILESRYGYLGFFVLPILVAFIYEIYVIVKEIKNPTEDE